MINDSSVIFKSDVLDNVEVCVLRPANHKARCSAPQRGPVSYENQLTTRFHGKLKVTNKTTGVFEELFYTVNIKKDPGGPLDTKFFYIALSKALLSCDELKGTMISIEDFIGFEYVQGYNGKFLGSYNEPFSVTELHHKTANQEQCNYHLYVKGIRSVNGQECQPFYIELALRTTLPYDQLIAAISHGESILDNLDVAVRQIVNKAVSGVEVLESIEVDLDYQNILCITYPNEKFYTHRGTIFANPPGGNTPQVWIKTGLHR